VIPSLLVPGRVVPSLTALDPADLVRRGIRGIILDLDNTIVAWGEAAPAAGVREWVARARAAGLRGCIVSNNWRAGVRRAGEVLGLPVVGWALKPIPFGFRRAMAIMGTHPAATALVGDQLLTDVLGGNLLGVHTILVDPLSEREFPTTRLVRRVERLIRSHAVRRAGRDRAP